MRESSNFSEETISPVLHAISTKVFSVLVALHILSHFNFHKMFFKMFSLERLDDIIKRNTIAKAKQSRFIRSIYKNKFHK